MMGGIVSVRYERETGRIKYFNQERGFGFVQTDDGRELFVHVSQLANADYFPAKNDIVEFTADKGRDGRPYARRVVHVQ